MENRIKAITLYSTKQTIMTTENNIATITSLEYKEYFDNGINYAKYKEQMADELVTNSDTKIKEYISLN